jgi:glucuronokinase
MSDWIHRCYLTFTWLIERRSAKEPRCFHNNVRERWNRQDSEVVSAMRRWAEIAAEGRAALLAGDHGRLNELINENFDLRSRIYQVGSGNLEMIQTARKVGASSNFAGSGGAIVGSYEDESMFQKLQAEMKPLGVAVVKPMRYPE